MSNIKPNTIITLTSGRLPMGVSVSYSTTMRKYQFWNGMTLIDELKDTEVSNVGAVVLSVHGMPRLFDRKVLHAAFTHPGIRHTVIGEKSRMFPRLRCWFRSIKFIITGAFSK